MAPKSEPRSKMDISDCSAKRRSDDYGVEVREDLKVDIMECGNRRDEFQEKEEEDLSQASSSSSFGDLTCAYDDDFGFGYGDEAQSMLSKDYPLPETFDGSDVSELTKRKTVDRWRRSTRSIMWRCKWFELKCKELQSQARRYEKDVENYNRTKQVDLEKLKSEGVEGKSIPFHDQTLRMKVFERGRRKRVEETTDVAAYMSDHNVFSYADKRMPINLKAQYHDSDCGTGRKAMGKQDGIEDGCLNSELDPKDVFLAKLLCKIDETRKTLRSLTERVDHLTGEESQTSPKLSTPQSGNQCAFVEDLFTRSQTEASAQIGRQCISTDYNEHLLMPQTPPTQFGGQYLINNSPISSKSLRFRLQELDMDEPEINDDDFETDDEKLRYFRKLMNEITGVPSEEADAEEDSPPATKRRKTSH